jgi:protocatechuate 3,4-dioxygenase beta subunit
VFQDRNANGQHDGLDLPWSGMSITLRDAQNLIRGTATSGEDGFVGFASLAPGAYSLSAVFPPGYTPTTAHPVVVQVTANAESSAQLGLAPTIRILHFLPLIHQP